MSRLYCLFLFCIPFALVGQTGSQFSVQGRFDACEADTIRLFFLDGISLRQAAATPVQQDPTGKFFAFSFQSVPPGFYFIGGGAPINTRMVLLGIDSLVFLKGTYQAFYQAEILYSTANDAWNNALKISQQLQTQTNQLNQQYQRQKSTGQELGHLIDGLNRLDQQKLSLLDSLERVHPVLRQAMALRSYLAQPVVQQRYQSEVAFFADTYFAQSDLTDPAYQHMPLVQESFQSFAKTLAAVTLPLDSVLAYCRSWLEDLPVPGPTHKMAILGLSAGFNGGNDDAFVQYAEEYLRLYPGDNPEFSESLRGEINTKKSLLIGAVAPDLKLPTPDGDSLGISELRGQVVLLDFWASWCRPCRMENPRVKRMYDQYHRQGFEILGVSLDRNRSSWEQAIIDDDLPWFHVSDLKQWQSVASKTYKVGSIPHTVLLDRDGRIVAKGLRGAALEAKVAELLDQQPLEE